MADEKKRSVGLLCLTNDPDLGLCAVLQVRGPQNEHDEPQSWAGGCQVTVHGKLEPGETFIEALWREVREELGGDFGASLKLAMAAGAWVTLVNIEDDKKRIVTWGVEVPREPLDIAEPGPSVAGFRLLPQNQMDTIQDLSKLDKKTPVPPNVTAMFPDETEAVKKAFEIFT